MSNQSILIHCKQNQESKIFHLFLFFFFAGNSGRMEALSLLSKPIVDFAEKSVRLWKRCTKPDQKEYARVAQAVLLGILLLGLIGYFIRLIHIPINNILLG